MDLFLYRSSYWCFLYKLKAILGFFFCFKYLISVCIAFLFPSPPPLKKKIQQSNVFTWFIIWSIQKINKKSKAIFRLFVHFLCQYFSRALITISLIMYFIWFIRAENILFIKGWFPWEYGTELSSVMHSEYHSLLRV